MARTVVIVDDHEGFRRSARRLLESAGLVVVGEAADGAAALRVAAEVRPELVLLDVVLPDLDGFEVADRLRAQTQPPLVVLTSSRRRAEFGPRLTRTSAQGFVHKGELSAATLRAVLSAAQRSTTTGGGGASTSSVSDMRSAEGVLAALLGDPTVEVAYRSSPGDGYVDRHGRPVELPPHSRRVVPLSHRGVEMGALICAAAGYHEPALGETAGAIVILAAENERLLDGLRAQVRDLRERDEQRRALLDALPDLMFRFDRQGTYLEAWGPSRDDLVVPPDGELLGHRVSEVLPADVVQRFLGLVPDVLATRRMHVLEYDMPIRGEAVTFEARIVPSGVDEVLAIVRNITAQKSAEARLLALQAELRERLTELQASRARIVEAADAERRRVERDIHDGAQQRLLGARLALRLAHDRLAAGDARDTLELVGEADAELQEAVEELRALAQGLHPAVLTDEGLWAAVEVLARRASVPVLVRGATNERLPAQVEVAAYYVVSEALTNVDKHADARSATVEIAVTGGRVTVQVSDDGRGGADPARGTGLRGLADRVEALGGTVRVDSDPGRGTRVRVDIPCA